MPRDHFVAQTYLRRFVDDDGMLQAYRKDNGASFRSSPKGVCAEEDDDIIPDFLADSEFLGRYRAAIEPFWAEAVEALEGHIVEAEVKRRISLYWANLLVCTPSWTRVGVDIVTHLTQVHIQALLRNNPAVFGNDLRPAVEAVLDGRLRLSVEKNYVRALSAVHALKFAWGLYNSDWIVCRNLHEQAFITSDNPSSLRDPGDAWGHEGIVRYLPISPRLCVACRLGERAEALLGGEIAFERDPLGKVDFSVLPENMVLDLNEMIAKCAERFVLTGQANEYVRNLTANVARFRIENERIAIPQADGTLWAARIRVREH